MNFYLIPIIPFTLIAFQLSKTNLMDVIITHCRNIFIIISTTPVVSVRHIDVVIDVINQHTFIIVQQVTPFKNGNIVSVGEAHSH